MRCFQDLHTFRWPRIADSQQTLREANKLVLKSTIRSKRNAERCFGGRSKRLCYLKEASGLSWRGFAKALGVDPKQLRMWRRKGVEPCGGAMLSILRFASGIPGGMEILLGKGFQMTFFKKGS